MAPDVARLAVAVTRALRGLGVPASPDAAAAFGRALGEVGLARRSHVYWAGRATLVRRAEDVAAYDRVFAAVFGGRQPADTAPPDLSVPAPVTVLVDDGDGVPVPGADPLDPGDGPTLTLRWSDRELLRHKDFAACTVAELDEAHRLMADLRVVGARRPGRRRVRARRGEVDLRATVRAALRTGGEPLRVARRRADDRPRRVVLLCDISGSMEPYARALVRFAHTAVVGRTAVEVFTLGTRCTRITRELRTRDPDAALGAAAVAVEDWSGGTRLGEGLRSFNEGWGLRGLARGATVVVLSDGWDRGDPDVLGREVERLHRAAHRLIWVNPLKASPGFAPVARGMAAALPHVDDLVEGHSLQSLDDLVDVMAR
jgi:uncharacterized protein